VPCAQVVQRSHILPSLVQLLVQGQEALTACGEVVTPKWLAPLLLLIDLLEKVAMCTQRRDRMYKVSDSECLFYHQVHRREHNFLLTFCGLWHSDIITNLKMCVKEAYHDNFCKFLKSHWVFFKQEEVIVY
jgi:hypothetical protein